VIRVGEAFSEDGLDEWNGSNGTDQGILIRFYPHDPLNPLSKKAFLLQNLILVQTVSRSGSLDLALLDW
jgi:hypothetical protein